MVEMGLVVMLLLTLTFGIADLGIFMFKYVQAANCVREAARRAVVRDPNAGSPPLCVSSDLQPTVSPAGYATLKAGQPVTATINQTHTWIVIGYLVPGMGDTVPLKAATTMRMEGQFSPGT
jgi:hypothetical protein